MTLGIKCVFNYFEHCGRFKDTDCLNKCSSLFFILYVAIQVHHQMILGGSYVGVIMRVAEYTVDCAVALGAPLGFGRATQN